MDSRTVGRWLANADKPCTDEEFAEAMVFLWRYHNHMEDRELTEEDMKDFDVGTFTDWIRDCLNEILFSDEICSLAWWKIQKEGMYNNQDIQNMIIKCNSDGILKQKILDSITNISDRSAISDVLEDGDYERFDRYDSDVCEQFIKAFTTIKR